MVSCPQCRDAKLSPSPLKLGTPAFPIKCNACGTEFHGSYFWVAIVALMLATVGALIGATVLSTFWRSSLAILVPFAVAITVLYVLTVSVSRRQVPVPTRPFVKRASHIVLAILCVYVLTQAVLGLVAA